MEKEKDDLNQTNQELARACIKKNMLWSMGAGLIPVPLLDLAVVTGVQVKLLKELSGIYDVPFSEHRGKSLVSALFGGLAVDSLTTGLAGSALKAIPFAGSLFGFLTMPLFSASASYALGKVFVQHYESGGTMLTFDPEKMRAYFQAQFQEGQQAASGMKRRDSPVSA